MSFRAASRTSLIAALTVFALVASACGGGDEETEEPTGTSEPTGATGETQGSVLAGKELGLVTWGFDQYQQAYANWFTKLAEDQGASVRVIDGKIDPAVQADAIDDLIAAGVDGIALQPVEPAAAVPSVQAAQDAGIPIVLSCNRTDPESGAVAPAAICNEGANTRTAGEGAGAWVQETFPGEPAKLVIFDITTLPLCHDLRMDNFVEGVTSVMGAENVEIVFRDTVEHRREVSLAKMEDQLQRDPDFNIFTACGAEGVLGGIEGLERAGRAQAVDKDPQTEWILTIDGTPDELTRLFDPSSAVMVTITLAPKEMAETLIDLLTRVIAGELEPDAEQVVDIAGVILPTDCTEAAAIFQEQYGLNEGYEPLEC